jgi:hypothetical protein
MFISQKRESPQEIGAKWSKLSQNSTFGVTKLPRKGGEWPGI